jgi:CheY-like chemotaxis protein
MRLNLPRAVASPHDAAPNGDERPARSIRILVVDDDARLVALAAGMLRRDKHHVTEAFSAQEALDLLRTEPFDLMISDLSMGDGMNGWELAAVAMQELPSLPIVLATGWGAAIDEEEARSRGVMAVLAKPFRVADLRDVIDRVVPV